MYNPRKRRGRRVYVEIWLTFPASAGAICDPLCGFFSCPFAWKTRWETWNGNWKIGKGGVELEHGSLCFIGSLDITFVAATISFYASTLFKTLYPFVQSPWWNPITFQCPSLIDFTLREFQQSLQIYTIYRAFQSVESIVCIDRGLLSKLFSSAGIFYLFHLLLRYSYPSIFIFFFHRYF